MKPGALDSICSAAVLTHKLSLRIACFIFGYAIEATKSGRKMQFDLKICLITVKISQLKPTFFLLME